MPGTGANYLFSPVKGDHAMTQPAEPTPTPPPAPPAPPAPVPAPPPPPAPPAPPAPAPTPSGAAGGARPAEPGTGDDLPYYQEGVPWRQLPPEQQVAYWMHRSRKHEDRVSQMRDYEELRQTATKYNELLAQHQTEHERAVAEARRQGESAAMARANTMLVEAYVRSAAAARGVEDDAVTDLLETLDLSKFVNASTGQVDTAKVYRQVNRMAGAPAPQAPSAGVPAAPAVPAPPTTGQPPQPPSVPGWPPAAPAPGQPAPAYAQGGGIPPGQPAPYAGQPVPAAPQWPGQIPAPPSVPGQPAAPGGPDYGQGAFTQAPPSGLEAGRAAARARYGNRVNSQISQVA